MTFAKRICRVNHFIEEEDLEEARQIAKEEAEKQIKDVKEY